ncbi:MAG: ComF family protein [Bacteroidales bacterium]|nr:ComF family protein [Bacteroidales bacterium]
MNRFFEYTIHFFRLFFPKNCEACNTNLIKGETTLCTDCLYEIPKTNFHQQEDNPLNRLFYGITKIKYSTAFYFFKKGSKFQILIHKLKYNEQKELGVELGRMAGREIKNSLFEDIDIIIPVPLHPAKKRLRGYNQSEMICKGLSEILEKESLTNVLVRHIYTQTQTKKNIEERRKNVNSAFKVINSELIQEKHILLVDDVITTGSTLVACANELLKTKNVIVSILAVAFADV